MTARKSPVALLLLTLVLVLAGAGSANAYSASTTAQRYIGCGGSPFFSKLGGYAYNRSSMTYGATSMTVTSAASTLNSYSCTGRKPYGLYTKKTDSMIFSGVGITGVSIGTSGATVSGGATSKTVKWNRSAKTANLTNYYSNIKVSGFGTKFTYKTDATWATRSNYADAIVTSVSDHDYL